jgi:mono/diheme cytochrome c family protein
MANETNNSEDKELVGLLAQFDDPDSLIAACNNARETGYKKMDAYTPFPVHGIDPALGIQRSKLPFIVLSVALGAVVLGLGMQWYTNSTDNLFGDFFPGYRFKISGKPYFSLPANIPVTFEVIVLSSAFATFFGMWIINRLPRLSNPLHRVSRFKRVTNDKFFLMLEKADGLFNESESRAQLEQWGAVAIEEVNQDLTDTKLPSFLAPLAVILMLLLLVPPVAIFSAYGSTSRKPRLHVVPDMDWQHKFKTQTMSPNIADKDNPAYLFEDLRSMRQPVEGSVQFNSMEDNPEMYQGIKAEFYEQAMVSRQKQFMLASTGAQDEDSAATDAAGAADAENVEQWIDGFPEGFVVNEKTLARGKQRFNIYCAVCHGYAGNGDGLVNQRAVALAANGQALWTAAKSLHDPTVKDTKANPTGRIFDTITNGRNTMGPYKDQIPVADRWAIVAYVKALQETGIEPVSANANADTGAESDAGAEADAAAADSESDAADADSDAAEEEKE